MNVRRMHSTNWIVQLGRSVGLSKPAYWTHAEEISRWIRRKYASPSPNFIKRRVLVRSGLRNCTWIETGTYRGDTTQLLAKYANRVLSIEPDRALFIRARKELGRFQNITILNGCSENLLPKILPDIHGDVCFWLDGHFSNGTTFQGDKDSPIQEELSSIERHLPRFGNVAIFIDDVRMFEETQRASGYISLDALVDWSRAQGLRWKIEHDIFIASRSIIG